MRPLYDRQHIDFSCAIAATLAMHGRMYPTDTHVCFYSNVFGRERKVRIFYANRIERERESLTRF